MSSPLEFKPGVFYPKAVLEERLEGIMSLQTFLSNLGLDGTGRGRIFQNGLWGDEILHAVESTIKADKPVPAPKLEAEKRNPAAIVPMQRRAGRPAKSAGGFLPVSSDEVLTGRRKSER